MEDRTPQEEYKLLLLQLPTQWQMKILQEEAKRKKGKWLVRIANLPSKGTLQIKHDLETALGRELDTVQSTVNGSWSPALTPNLSRNC